MVTALLTTFSTTTFLAYSAISCHMSSLQTYETTFAALQGLSLFLERRMCGTSNVFIIAGTEHSGKLSRVC